MEPLSTKGHERMFAAITAREPGAAEHAAIRHLEYPKDQLYRYLFGMEPVPAKQAENGDDEPAAEFI
jgi:DNA-binding GntR family transcriptional regulator